MMQSTRSILMNLKEGYKREGRGRKELRGGKRREVRRRGRGEELKRKERRGEFVDGIARTHNYISPYSGLLCSEVKANITYLNNNLNRQPASHHSPC